MKNRYKILVAVVSIAVTAMFIVFVVLTNLWIKNKATRNIFLSISIIFVIAYISLLISAYYINWKTRIEVGKSFNYYAEKLIASSGVGLILFNNNGRIIWVSDFLSKKIKSSLLGKELISISENFADEYKKGKNLFRFDMNGTHFEALINVQTKILILKDVTNESIIMQQYSDEKMVVGELEIDNFQQYQIILSREEIFRLQSSVINMLNTLAEDHNISYRQYVSGKFMLLTDHSTLQKLTANRFNFLNEIRKISVIDGIKLSVSIGFGYGSTTTKDLFELANNGLMQAQSRGGDQVGVISPNKKSMFFGSKSEIAKSVSRVKVKQIASLFFERLNDENIKHVIIYGHLHADLDAIGSALGIADIVKFAGKTAYIQNVDLDVTTAKAVEKHLSKEENSLFIRPSKARKLVNAKNTIVVMTDIAKPDRTESPELLEKPAPNNIFVFDHHRINEVDKKIPHENVYIETTASSASEIVSEIAQFIKGMKFSRTTAQMLLNGIYLDTMQFQKSTSSRTFQAASYLESCGADAKLASESLKVSEEESLIIQEVIANTREVKPGYYISAYAGETQPDVISKAADEILRTSGRKAAFVIAKIKGTKTFKMSARGLDTNVQVIAESVGGGGHFGAAAATSTESLEVFRENLIQAIVDNGEG